MDRRQEIKPGCPAQVAGVAWNAPRDAAPEASEQLAAEVAEGLACESGRRVPAAVLYDAEGSRLFEEITSLPEYYPTRLESRLLDRLAPTLARRCPAPGRLVELGSGSSAKTQTLLAALGRRFARPSYLAIDVSGSALRSALAGLRARFWRLDVQGLVGTFEMGLASLAGHPAPLVLLLGGTIGNLDQGQLLGLVDLMGRVLPPGSLVLVGYDRPPHPGKPVEVIEAAYNDSRGVTERFNRNVLARLNREYGANFHLESWRHEARWVQATRRIEMRLVAESAQRVRFPALGTTLEFRAQEGLLTEISRRFSESDLVEAFASGGFVPASQWQDPRAWFGLMLLRKARQEPRRATERLGEPTGRTPGRAERPSTPDRPAFAWRPATQSTRGGSWPPPAR